MKKLVACLSVFGLLGALMIATSPAAAQRASGKVALSDAALATEARAALDREIGAASRSLGLDARGGTVTLSGSLPDAVMLERAKRAVASVPGASRVSANAVRLGKPAGPTAGIIGEEGLDANKNENVGKNENIGKMTDVDAPARIGTPQRSGNLATPAGPGARPGGTNRLGGTTESNENSGPKGPPNNGNGGQLRFSTQVQGDLILPPEPPPKNDGGRLAMSDAALAASTRSALAGKFGKDKASKVQVQVRNGVVTLTGIEGNQLSRVEVEAALAGLNGARAIETSNLLDVRR